MHDTRFPKQTLYCKENSDQVTNGVQMWSVLGPLIFTFYVNDLDEGIEVLVAKLEDDVKISGIEKAETLKKDLGRLALHFFGINIAFCSLLYKD